MDDFIQLKKDNILRIGIKDSEGKDTKEHLEFDLEDIELPLKLSECEFKHKKNIEYLKNQMIIIDKKQDKKGKYILSSYEKEKILVIKEFYQREIKALDLFLGEGGTNKILNGRKPYYSMYDDISKIIEPILPKLQIKAQDIAKKIKEKYSNKKEENTLE